MSRFGSWSVTLPRSMKQKFSAGSPYRQMFSPSWYSRYVRYFAIYRMSSSSSMRWSRNASWFRIREVSYCVSHGVLFATRFLIICFTVVYLRMSRKAWPIYLFISFFLLSVSSAVILLSLLGFGISRFLRFGLKGSLCVLNNFNMESGSMRPVFSSMLPTSTLPPFFKSWKKESFSASKESFIQIHLYRSQIAASSFFIICGSNLSCM